MKKYLTPFLIILSIIGFFSTSLYYRHHCRYQVATYDIVPGNGLPGIFSFLHSLESTLYDTRISTMKPEKAKKVFVATIDEAALSRYGRWPWSRYVYKEILNDLYQLGAEVVGFDAVFSEAEWKEDTVEYTLTAKPGLDESIYDMAKLSESQLQILKDRLSLVGEADFAHALNKHPSTVQGYLWPDDSDCIVVTDKEKKEEHRNGFTVQGLIDTFSAIHYQSFSVADFSPFEQVSKLVFPTSRCVVTNRSAMAGSTKYHGYFNSIPDPDGIFRRTSPIYGLNASLLLKAIPLDEQEFLNENWFKSGSFFPSLALRSIMSYLDIKDSGAEDSKTDVKVHLVRRDSGDLEIQGFDIIRKSGAIVKIPTNPDGSLNLKFYGSQKINSKSAPPIGEFSLAYPNDTEKKSFMDAYGLKDKNLPLKDSIVFIGPTAIGVYDLRPNPTDGTAAGVFLHATAAARLLDYINTGDPRDLSIRMAETKYMQAALWIFSIILFVLSASMRGLLGFSAYLFYVVALFSIDWWLFRKEVMAMDSVTLAIAFTFVYLTVTVYKYLTEEKERAYIKNKFKSSVSPEIVEAMLKDPESMKGKKAELSVLFSDIRGFTTISESLTAVQLAEFMNSYLSPMTDLVFKHGGTLDKYMGDAIMAIFGAPIFFPNHAERIVECALEQMIKLQELKAQWKAQGLPEPLQVMDIGIGINTGEVSVGMMGSQTLSSYTVMGDSVNLASRLEGLNKEYGSHVIVSEFTYAQLPKTKFVTRRLDRVKVKGKTKPVEIYEVLGLIGGVGTAADHFGEFEKAMDLYFKGNFNEAQPIFQKYAVQDVACELFAERCQIFVQDGAPSDWDGAWTMKTK